MNLRIPAKWGKYNPARQGHLMMTQADGESIPGTGKCELRRLTQMIHKILRQNAKASYELIRMRVSMLNRSTANRRIYDVLNIMISLNMVVKRGRTYFLKERKSADLESVYEKRINEIRRLEDIKRSFIRLVDRNDVCMWNRADKLYLPFVLIVTDKNAKVHVEVNDNRTFYRFKSDKRLWIVEDVEVIRSTFKSLSTSDDKENTSMFAGSKHLVSARGMNTEDENEPCACIF